MGYEFIIGAEKRQKSTKIAIDLVIQNITAINNRIDSGIFAVSSQGCFYGTMATMHVYFDRSLADDQ
jgi:hypothetical protein